MTFDESNVNRQTDGQFGNKLGAAPEVALLEQEYGPAPGGNLDTVFDGVVWNEDGSFFGGFGGTRYGVQVTPDRPYVYDGDTLLAEDHPAHRAARIAIGDQENDSPVPPAPVVVVHNGKTTELGALYNGWDRSDVIAARVTRRIAEAKAAGQLPDFEYTVTHTASGADQGVSLSIHAPEESDLVELDGSWTPAASAAYHHAGTILGAWNKKTTEPWADEVSIYRTKVDMSAGDPLFD